MWFSTNLFQQKNLYLELKTHRCNSQIFFKDKGRLIIGEAERHHEDKFGGPNLVGIFDEVTTGWILSIGLSPPRLSLRILSLWHSRWNARVGLLPPVFSVFR